MLHALERAQRVANHRHGNARLHGAGHSGQCVFQIVRPGNAHFAHATNGPRAIRRAKIQRFLPHKRAKGRDLRARKPHHAAHGFGRQRAQSGVVVIEHHAVAVFLIFKDARLQFDIALHGLVPVHMILGDIEDGGNQRMELGDGFQLEGGQLANDHIVCLGLGGDVRVGRANVAHHKRALARVFANFSQQGCGGRFPIGARDRHDLAHAHPIGQFHLANHFNAHFPRLGDRRVLDGHARADHHQVHAVQQRLRVLSQSELHIFQPQAI